MGGGLMQLVAYGAQDVYITGNPQITFFKVVYRRHTNFSVEVVEHPLTNAGFGRRASVTVLRNGDLATKMYLKTKVSGTGDNWAFVNKLGHALIKNVELEIGGSKIDKQYGVWMDIWYELSHEVGQEAGYNQMIGNTAAMTTRNGENKESTLYVPLQFWFCRNTGLALPLIALQYHEVRVHFEFNNASELTRHVGNAPTLTMETAELLVDYVFLDSEERRRFAQVGHEYLIEQLQFTGEESANANAEKYKLSFNHPTKELVWAVRQGKFMGQKFLGETLDEVAKTLVASCYATANADSVPTDTWADLGTDANHICIDDDWSGVTDETGTLVGNKTLQCQALGVNAGENTNDEQVHVLNGTTNLLSLIDYSTTLVDKDGNITVTSVAHRLTMELVSESLDTLTDERTTVAKVQAKVNGTVTSVGSEEGEGVVVNQWDNYGMNLDGSGNPVEAALIQLNGHDRFDEQEGDYFNYVQPWQHHTNTPPAGVNVYSFSLAPEQHQPQGSANLSRIDNTQLNVRLASRGRAADNRMYIFAFSYNVLRIMSGMGGLAYSN